MNACSNKGDVDVSIGAGRGGLASASSPFGKTESAISREIARTAWGLVCFKTAYFTALIAGLLVWGDLGEFVRLPQRWTPKGGPSFASHFSGWDAGYYLSLSEQGYHAGDSACAFNPLWPLLVRVVSPLAGNRPLIGGLVLANVLSAAGCLLFFVVAGKRFGAKAAKLALLFLVAFPGSLFFQFAYSEPLFFLLVMLLWWGIERRCYGATAAAAFLLPLARGVGVFALLPLAWHVLEPASDWASNRIRRAVARLGINARGGRASQSREMGPAQAGFPLRPVVRRVWLLAPPLAGFGSYLALMAWWTGNPFEGFTAQKYWGVHSVWNLVDLPKFALGFVSPTTWHAFTGSLLDRCVFVLVLYLMPVIFRLGKDLTAWTVMLAWVPAMSGTFTSFTRFASCAFPLFIGLGVFFSRPDRRAGRFLLLGVFVILHAVLVWRYVNCLWAG
jgi:hypothetical protein